MKITGKIKRELQYSYRLARTFFANSRYSADAVKPVEKLKSPIFDQLPDRRFGPDYRDNLSQPFETETVYRAPPVAGSKPILKVEIPSREEKESKLIQAIKPRKLDLFG